MISPGKYRISDDHLTNVKYCNSDFHHILIFSASSFSITNAHYKLQITPTVFPRGKVTACNEKDTKPKGQTRHLPRSS